MEQITLRKLKTKQKTFRFMFMFSLFVILFINFLTKVSMYE